MSFGNPNDKQLEHFDSVIGNVQKILARRDIYRLELAKLAGAVDSMVDVDDSDIIYAGMRSGIFKMLNDLLAAVPAAVDSRNFEAIFASAMAIIGQITVYNDGVVLYKTGSDLVSKMDLVAAHAVIMKGISFLRGFTSILNVRNEHATDVEYERSGLRVASEGGERLANTEARRAVDREMTARNERNQEDEENGENEEGDGDGEPAEA